MESTTNEAHPIIPASDTKDDKQKYRMRIVWRNVFAMIILHMATIYAIYLGFNPTHPWYGFFIPDIIGRFAGFGVIAGAHRLWAHRCYKAKLPLRVFLMLWHTVALQDDIYQWVRDHRLHHKYSDTDADPYNAQRGFFFSHIGWLLVRKHPEVIKKGKTIVLDDVLADPVVRFQRTFYIPLAIVLWGVMPTYVFHYLTGISFWESFLFAVIYRYVVSLHFTWLVNSAAHLYGMQPFDKNLEPRENRLVNYITVGEGYHNYHHGWERCFNLSTMFIDACAKLGLAYDLKKPKKSEIDKRVQRCGDQTIRLSYVHPTSTVMDWIKGVLVVNFIPITYLLARMVLHGQF